MLSAWVKNAGRVNVLSLGSEDRSRADVAAQRIVEEAKDYDYDAEEILEDYLVDPVTQQPRTDPRLMLNDDLMLVQARDRVRFEVAHHASSRSDRRVYRADIDGVRHPDTELIVEGINALPRLLDTIDDLMRENAALKAALAASSANANA